MFVNVQRTLENMGHFFFSFVGCQFLSVSCKVHVSILLQSQLLDLFPGAAASHCVWHDLPLVFHVVAQPSWPWVLQPPRWTVPPRLLLYGCILTPGESLRVLLHSQQREGVQVLPALASRMLSAPYTGLYREHRLVFSVQSVLWHQPLALTVVALTSTLTYIHIYECVSRTCLCACVYVHVYTYVCTHIHVHTHLHIYILVYV